MFTKWGENTVGKREIACYSIFKRLLRQTRKSHGLFGKVKHYLNKFQIYQTYHSDRHPSQFSGISRAFKVHTRSYSDLFQ